jgi:hypothetical protein
MRLRLKAIGSLLPAGEVAIRISKPTMKASAGVLAQLVERLNGIEEVTGSNPVGSIYIYRQLPLSRLQGSNRRVTFLLESAGSLGAILRA